MMSTNFDIGSVSSVEVLRDNSVWEHQHFFGSIAQDVGHTQFA